MKASRGFVSLAILAVVVLLGACAVIFLKNPNLVSRPKQLPTTIITLTPSPIPQPTGQKDGETEEIVNNSSGAATKAMGYINAVYDENGKGYLKIDYIQWLGHPYGCSIEKSPNLPQCNPNGYLIVNNNPKIRTFEISKNAEIIMQQYNSGECGGTNWNESISYETFNKLFNDKTVNCSKYYMVGGPPFNIEIKDNKVVKITEQYIP